MILMLWLLPAWVFKCNSGASVLVYTHHVYHVQCCYMNAVIACLWWSLL